MSTATRRNSSKTGNDLESDPERIRTIRRELSIEYTHNERDNIMESSFKGKDLSEQHDHHGELQEKKNCISSDTFLNISYNILFNFHSYIERMN